MMKRFIAICIGFGLAGTMACVDGDIEDEPPEESGLNLVVDYDETTDVVGIRYNIKRVPCAESGESFDPFWVVKDKDKTLKELTLPGGISTFNDEPFFENSSHRFADYFTLIEAGCYDVSAQPMKELANYDKGGKVSKDCPHKVSTKGVEVVNGKTTEVLLISQCEGDGRGALDVIAALNRAPKIVKIQYKSAHMLKCKYGSGPVQVKVCGRAVDPDGDPMNFYWGQKWGPEIDEGQPVVDHSEQVGKVKTECVTYTLPELEEGQATYMLTLSVYDKFVDKYGDLVHAEDWINDKFYKGEKKVKSRHIIKFPVRLICKDVKVVKLENSATVSSDEVDVNPENNTDTATVKVKGYQQYCGYPKGSQ